MLEAVPLRVERRVEAVRPGKIDDDGSGRRVECRRPLVAEAEQDQVGARRRGLIATCYARVDGDARALVEAAYAGSSAVRVLPEGVAPELARVQHTDGAEIGVFEDCATGRSVVVCALDNLGKGAAGQAVQNANLALGLDETLGLKLTGVPV